MVGKFEGQKIEFELVDVRPLVGEWSIFFLGAEKYDLSEDEKEREKEDKHVSVERREVQGKAPVSPHAPSLFL